MHKQIIPSIPLITHDPYFSVWVPGNTLNGHCTECWTGAKKPIAGEITIDGTAYRFLGEGDTPILEQRSLTVEATSTVALFRGADIELTVRFTSPLLLSDLELVSRPCTYMDFAVRSLSETPHKVHITVTFDERHCYDGTERQELIGGVHRLHWGSAAWMGKRKQSPLNHSGDGITIDWGYLYLAVQNGKNGTVTYNETDSSCLRGVLELGEVLGVVSSGLVAAYDDVQAIQYFGQPRKAYWARGGKTILEAIGDAVAEHDTLLTRCDVLDQTLREQATEAGGGPYAAVCAAAYRQTIAAHKLITDEEGNVIFLSKECYSNGCIGTADVSYPSVPLYLMAAPELVKGMLRPIFRFAKLPVWPYEFAPHDVGRYPYADGQVYGAYQSSFPNGAVQPPYYLYPAGSSAFDYNMQMPVEECGNMLIMTAAVCVAQGDYAFARDYLPLLEQWACYLIQYGTDPGNQLCTDDFAGHLAHNVNLSAKAIVGIAAYARILAGTGQTTEAEQYLRKAKRMASDWEQRADRNDHTALTFDRQEGWSLKYNLVWDLLFDTQLFTDELYQREIAWYLTHQNRFGVPLDSRESYTKSDWILWVAAMAQRMEDRRALIQPVAEFLTDSPDRVPFGDWYDTITGAHFQFQNRTVQGGLFMPLLMDAWRNGAGK